MPLEEFDVGEIAQIVKITGTSNIGAGNTEIILSYIYWILINMVKDR